MCLRFIEAHTEGNLCPWAKDLGKNSLPFRSDVSFRWEVTRSSRASLHLNWSEFPLKGSKYYPNDIFRFRVVIESASHRNILVLE